MNARAKPFPRYRGVPRGKTPLDCCVALERGQLRQVYPRLEDESDWHRISQRVHVLNKTVGRRCAARFVLNREKASLRAYAGSPEALRVLVRSLREGRGFIQKALADALERRAAQAMDGRSVPRGLRAAQAGFLKDILSRDLGHMAGADLDRVLVDLEAPGSLARRERSSLGPGGGGGRSESRSTLARLAALLPSSALILGGPGAGKTALLYSALESWEQLGAGAAGLSPVYLPARCLSVAWGRPIVSWESLPGADADSAERLRAAFDEGRLALLLDGLAENPDATDFTNPAAHAFWTAAARNCCLIATTPRHFAERIQVSPLRSFFPRGLRSLSLEAWGPERYAELFARLADAARRSRPNAAAPASLAALSVEDWARTAGELARTPLNGLACAAFFASTRGEPRPRDEYELQEHLAAFHLRHEGFKGASVAPPETILGLLSRLGWLTAGEGRCGLMACVSGEDAARMAREAFPALGDRQADLLRFLARLPQVEYSPETGLFCLRRTFADYLAARHLLTAFLSGDARRLKEAARAPWDDEPVLRLLRQGLRRLPQQARLRFLQATQAVFEAERQEGSLEFDGARYDRGPAARDPRRDPPELEMDGREGGSLVPAEPGEADLRSPGPGRGGRDAALARLLMPLGWLDLAEARDFLWSVIREGPAAGEAATWAAAAGLARAGDARALESYVERMRIDAGAAEFNMSWTLFRLRRDRGRRDIGGFSPRVLGRWDAAADWLMAVLASPEPEHRRLRALYACTLGRFIRHMGPAPFAPAQDGGEGPRRLADLGRVIEILDRDPDARASPALARESADLRHLAARLDNRPDGREAGAAGGQHAEGTEPARRHASGGPSPGREAGPEARAAEHVGRLVRAARSLSPDGPSPGRERRCQAP